MMHSEIRGVYEAQGQNYPENIWSSFFVSLPTTLQLWHRLFILQHFLRD